MSLHVVYETNASDMPAALRLLADEIEDGEVPAESVALVIRTEANDVHVRGIGKTDSVRCFMDLHAGAAELLR